MDSIQQMIYATVTVASLIFLYIIWNYIKHLKESPRELYILFISKIVEYSAYGAMNLALVLYLSADVGLGDISAGSYIGTWSILLTIGTMLVGSICDAIGIKKTLLLGTLILLFSRFFFCLTSNIYLISILGFIPLAFGTAMLGPVLSVGIKKYTTKETSALGFALFYTLMNVGWAIGGQIFDMVRIMLGEHVYVTLPYLPLTLSTYQVIFLIGFILTIPNFFILSLMREGVVLSAKGEINIEPPKDQLAEALVKTVVKAARSTVEIFKNVISERSFWIFIFMLAIFTFVRLSFYHFHYTFPKYAIRVLGEGLKIGSIFSVLNPVLIIFLAPLFAHITRKAPSYIVLLIGTMISSMAIFIAAIPLEWFSPLMNSWVGELILNRWLNVPPHLQSPLFIALVFMVIIFTIGEALWSPRFMQFTAEIAPKGKEGSYISLSYLPFFAGKLIVGPFSGWLLATYTPQGAADFPHHHMVWIWMGASALVTPIGLLLFRFLFKAREEQVKNHS